MTRQEHLLTILSEECAEVAQRVSKALRFTLKEVQPGQNLNNAERIMEEFYDLVATLEKCQSYNLLPEWSDKVIEFHKDSKKIKIEKFLDYSKTIGSLNP